jgi:hypothetical protein
MYLLPGNPPLCGEQVQPVCQNVPAQALVPAPYEQLRAHDAVMAPYTMTASLLLQ